MRLQIGNLMFTLHTGGLIPLLLMLPNFLWMALSRGVQEAGSPPPLWLNIVENVGRAAILLLPFFYDLNLSRPLSRPAAVGMGLALGVYYIAWVRYFTGSRTPELLGAPLFGIPLPLAVAPVALLLFSAYLMGSWWMLAASIVFGAAHIWVSALPF